MKTLFSSLFKRRPDTGEEGKEGEGDRAQDNKSGISYFKYTFRGSIGGNSFTRTAEIDGDKVTLSLQKMEKRDYGKMEGEAAPGFAAALEELCRKHKIVRWNGFDKNNRRVLDGSGFNLRVKFKDGKEVEADGSNAFPNGYRDFVKDMGELFKPEEDKLLEKRRLQLAAEGVSGELKFVMINIVQNHGFGGDSYFAMLSVGGVRSANCEFRIKSYTGEYLPEGEYSVCKTVPDEMIGMEDFSAIAEKYKIIDWYDYEAYEDGKEYFQISFSYEKGRISAHGSKHPENYDGFRKEVIEKMISVFKAVTESGEEE